jgi:hypothetical protein
VPKVVVFCLFSRTESIGHGAKGKKTKNYDYHEEYEDHEENDSFVTFFSKSLLICVLGGLA